MPGETASTLKEYTGRTANHNHLEITEDNITKTDSENNQQTTIPKETSTVTKSSTIYFDPLPSVFILIFVGMSFVISMVISFAYNSLLIQIGTFILTLLIMLLMLQPQKAPKLTIENTTTGDKISLTLSEAQYKKIIE